MIEVDDIDDYIAAAFRRECNRWPSAWSTPEVLARFRSRLEFHGIAFALCQQMGDFEDWPAELLGHIRQETRAQTFWEESHHAVMAAMLDNLQAAGVDAIVMKGTALAYSLYDVPAMRRRGDTDLLVHKRQLKIARSVLKRQGFQCEPGLPGLLSQETWSFETGVGFVHTLDLHWEATDSPTLQKMLQVDEIFARAVDLPRLQPKARTTDPVIRFIQCCMNQSWHSHRGYYVHDRKVFGGNRLIWAWDNHLQACAFTVDQWRELVMFCLERGVAPICLDGLDLASRHFGTSVPADVRSTLEGARQDTLLTRYLRSSDQFAEFISDLRASRGPGRKFSFMLANAFPTPAQMRKKYPAASGRSLPLLYLHRLLAVSGKWARKLAGR